MTDNLTPAAQLLAWYDRAGRDLPWRMRPGAGANDPYRVWLSEVMLQQTTVAAVKAYFARFTTLWPRVQDLAAAEDGDVMAAWAGLGYYARARNLLACARVVTDAHNGRFPSDETALLALPGIGPYTAAAIAAIAYDRRAVVVDGNVERVISRRFAFDAELPRARPALRALADQLTPDARPGDYAQAIMDLGATVCTPRSPDCGACPWAADCLARAHDTQTTFPRKAAKPEKPVRVGHVYVLRRDDGAYLVERRPPKGLLGSTLGFVTSDWVDQREPAPAFAPPADTVWRDHGTFRHTFTHFHLDMRVWSARATRGANPECGYFVDAADFAPRDLPSLMRKAFDLAQSHGA